MLEEKAWDATAALWRTSFTGYSIAGRKLTVTDPSEFEAGLAVRGEVLHGQAHVHALERLAEHVDVGFGAGERVEIDRRLAGVDLDAVKASFARAACGQAEVVHDARQFLGGQRPGRRHVEEATAFGLDEVGLGLGCDGRRCHGGLATGLQVHVRNAAHMPQLHHDVPTDCVHRIGGLAPGGHLRVVVDARGVGVAVGLGRNGCGFRDDQAGTVLWVGTLGVVLGHLSGGQLARGAVARQRGHHGAVAQAPGAHGDGFEEVGCLCHGRDGRW